MNINKSQDFLRIFQDTFQIPGLSRTFLDLWEPWTNVITSTYKKVRKDAAIKINQGRIKYAIETKVLDRIETNEKRNCFITLNDKTNFINHNTAWLINPASTK